jgi:GNAT superfamily N-acetyltransferase
MSGQASGAGGATFAGDGGPGKGAPAALTVRPAVRSDLMPLTFFFDTLLRKDYFLRRGQVAELLRGTHHQVYVAELDAVLVGAAVTTQGSRLVNLLVHPAYRRLGIGRALLEESGATEARAKIDMSSGDPRGFYRALGFRPSGAFNRKGNIEVLRRPRRMNGAARAATAGASAAEGTAGAAKAPNGNGRHVE